MKDAKPNAIWLSEDKADYDAVAVGDQVSIIIDANMIVEASYPGHAKARDVVKVKPLLR